VVVFSEHSNEPSDPTIDEEFTDHPNNHPLLKKGPIV
jgi:hypothetical protein